MGSVISKELNKPPALEVFGCVGCRRIPSLPVYSCGITGHSYCSGCARKFHKICVKMTDDFRFICGKQVKASLPKFLNNIFEATEFPCNYTVHGCTEILTVDRISYHELICSFKSYPCPFGPKCLWKGVILKSNFTAHLTEYHGVRKHVNANALTADVMIRRPVLPRDSKVCIWTEVVLQTEGVHFLLSFRYIKGFLCAWVWSFEPTFNKLFRVKICFISPSKKVEDERRTLGWWGTAVPYEIPVEEVVGQRLCMMLLDPENIQYEDSTKEVLPYWRLRVELHCQQIKIDKPAIVLKGNKQAHREDVKAAVVQCFSVEQSKNNIIEENNHNSDGNGEVVESAEVGKCDERTSSEMNKADVKVFHSANESDSEKEDGLNKKEKRSGISKDHYGTNNNEYDPKNFYQKVKRDMKEKVSNRKAKSNKSKKSPQVKNKKKGIK